METLNEKYYRLSQAYAATCDLLYELYQELTEVHAVWMERLTKISLGDLVRYDGKEGIFDACVSLVRTAFEGATCVASAGSGPSTV